MKMLQQGTSLAVHWLGLCASTAAMGSIPAQGTKIPHAAQHSQKNKMMCFFVCLFFVLFVF